MGLGGNTPLEYATVQNSDKSAPLKHRVNATSLWQKATKKKAEKEGK